MNTFILNVFAVTAPLGHIVEFALDSSNATDSDHFTVARFGRIYSLFFTIVALVCIHSMAGSFSKILPFENFNKQLTGLAFVLKLFHTVGGVLKFSLPKINGHDEDETYCLLIVCITSFLFLILAVLKTFTLHPSTLSKRALNEERVLQIPDRYLQEMNPPANSDSVESKFLSSTTH